MSDGWIKLHRQIQENDLWLMEPFTKGQAWVDLIILANHKDQSFDVRGNVVNVKRGQVARSEETLAKRWRWSRGKVRRFISMLETRQQIEQQKSHILSVISILNYDNFQKNDTTDSTTDGQQTDNRKTTDGQQTDTNKNEKKEKNDKNVKNEKNNTPKPPEGDFELFWKSNLKFNRKGDSKKTCSIRFKTAVKKFSTDQINQAVLSWREINSSREPEHFKGLSAWLWAENIQSALDGEHDRPKVLTQRPKNAYEKLFGTSRPDETFKDIDAVVAGDLPELQPPQEIF